MHLRYGVERLAQGGHLEDISVTSAPHSFQLQALRVLCLLLHLPILEDILVCSNKRKLSNFHAARFSPVFMASSQGVRQRWRQSKRRRAPSEPGAEEDELHEIFREALTIQSSIHTFDMNSQRAELAAIAWSNAPLLDEGSLLHANPALASVLEVLTTNAYSHTAAGDSEAHRRRSEFQLEGIMTSLQRAQSQKQMPLITARLSVACERNQLHQTTWRMLSLLAPGTLASHAWTEGFIEFARERRPPCEYEELSGVGAVMFNNYTRKVLYSSQVTVEKHGFRLDMTNSATMIVPKIVAPNVDADRIYKAHT